MCVTVLDQQSTNYPLAQAYPRDWRRRSADVGGLHLATEGMGRGQGWMGGDSVHVETLYAELLSDMYTETLNSVNDNSLSSVPAALPESVRSRLIHSLDRWHFEPHKLPEEEVLSCTLILFEALFRIEGMREAIPISFQQISAFIHHLRRIYRYENTYHNFEHALDVLQASQSYLKSAGMVPSPTILFEPNRMWRPKKTFDSGNLISCLGLRELFALYIAAIGHDVGHPGFTNGFMKNAKTPLSLVFDSSALEHMHCQLLLRVMRYHGLGVLLDDPKGNQFRKVLWQSVIATDMGVHKDFMERFKNLVDGEAGPICVRQVLICQAILKNADISNPTRPFYVSKHWANALMQEWTAQVHMEEAYQLKPTVSPSDEPVGEAGSQIFFITTFAKPLLELTVKAVPEMSMYLTHCKSNLQTWVKRKAELLKSQELEILKASKQNHMLPPPTSAPPAFSTGPASYFSSPPPSSSSSSSSSISPLSPPPPTSPRQSDWYPTAFPLTRPTYLPKITMPPESMYPPSCDSESASVPDSPSESESSTSASLFSPISDASGSIRCLSSNTSGSSTGKNSVATNASTIGSVNASTNQLSTPHAAIRAASRLGSIRQKQQKDLMNNGTANSANGSSNGSLRKGARNSWCANTVAGLGGSLAALFQSQSLSPALSQIPSANSSVAGSPAMLPAAMPASLAVAAGGVIGSETSGPTRKEEGQGHAPTTPRSVVNAPPLPPSTGPFLLSRPIKLQVSP